MPLQQAIDMGVARERAGQLQQAAEVYAQIIRQHPQQPEALHRLGLLMMRVGQLTQARDLVKRASAAAPRMAELHNNLGVINKMLGQLDDAGRCFEQAIKLKPDYAEALNNFGALLGERGSLTTSVKLIRRATELRAGYVDGLNNLGNALMRQGQVDDAHQAYRNAIATEPDHVSARSNYLLTLHYTMKQAPTELFDEHVRWGRRLVELAGASQPHANDRTPDRRLRVGYLSADFRAHSVCYFILPVLRAHDRTQIEVICYSDSPQPDEMTRQVRGSVDHWREVAGLPWQQVVHLVRQDRIDILIDLAGHTSGNRLPVFAARPAPVQISWLGYPDTTGLATMDYRFTDCHVDPPGEADTLSTEKLIRLDPCAWCYEPPADGPMPKRTTSEFIRFGSFNALAKLSDETIRLWKGVLDAVPQSHLTIKAIPLTDTGTVAVVRDRMRSHGLSDDRVELRGPTNAHRDHLSAYDDIDIALDSFPYHGTTTTCEALWMGVPVVTLAGAVHASRVGVSLLDAVGLIDLVANSPEQYIALAANLAADGGRLADLHNSLRDRLRASVLMVPVRLARSVEREYRAVWAKWCSS